MELWRLSAAQTANLIRLKQVSATEVAEAALARLDAVNPALNAVVDHNPEDVRAQASAVDAQIARGAALGPLAGVPVTIKINIDQKGYALVDASLVYTAPGGHWSLGVHGKNLFDKQYKTSGYSFVDANLAPTLGTEGVLTAYYGNPRQVFATATVEF